jgi:hypothetical protein
VATAVRNKQVVIGVCLIMYLLTGVLKSHAQTGAINLQKTVVLPANTIQLDSLLHLINRQAGVKFSINTRKIPASRPIRIKKQQQTVAGILQEIKQATGVYYAVLGDHIILLDNPPKRSVLLNKNRPGKKEVVKKQSQPPVTHQRQILPPKHTAERKPTSFVPAPQVTSLDPELASPLVNNDTAKTQPVTAQKQDTAIIRQLVHKRPGTANNLPVIANKSSSEERSFNGNLLVKGALPVDDVFYFGAAIQAGKPWLYGIASWNTNFKLSGFRYGAGTSISLSDDWKLHLQLTTGNLTSNFDTVGDRWQFKTQLHRAAVMGEVKCMKWFTIQFGPVLHFMKLTYSINDEKNAPGLSQPQVDQKFNLIKPIYTISDTYSVNDAQSKKIWIGFQVGICYDFLNSR